MEEQAKGAISRIHPRQAVPIARQPKRSVFTTPHSRLCFDIEMHFVVHFVPQRLGVSID